MANDVALLRLYAEQKSEAAFRDLVQRHLDMVYTAALRRVGGDAHAAEDIAQQVFAALAQRAPYLPESVQLAGWLYGTTRNLAVDYVRKERRRKKREAEASAMNPLISEPAMADESDWERLKPVLDHAMDKLDDRDREALLLRFFAQRPFAEVGLALGISADAARMRVDRALDRLHRSLSRRGTAPTVTAMALLLSEKAVSAAPATLHATVPAGALATAGAAPSSLAGILHIMATAKTSLALTVSVLLVIGFVSYREFQAVRTAEVEWFAEQSRVAALRRSLGEARREMAATEAALTVVSSPASPTPTQDFGVSAALVSPAPAPRTPAEMKAAGDAFLAKYPEMRERLVAVRRANITGRFQPLLQELALTPAQVSEFEAIVFAPSNLWIVQPGDAPPMRLILDGPTGDDDVRGRLQQLLGPVGYQRYTEYMTAAQGRSLTQQLARNLYATPTPLTTPQAAALVQTIKETPRTPGSGKLDWNSIAANAGAFLSEPQLTLLRGMGVENTYQAAMTAALKAARAPTAAAPAP